MELHVTFLVSQFVLERVFIGLQHREDTISLSPTRQKGSMQRRVILKLN